MQEQTFNSISVSWKWANKKIDCTLKGILKGCLGECCKGNFYPAKANGGKCVFLGSEGCELEPIERPVKCLLYPFVVKNGKLGVYGRAIIGSCKKCYFPGSKEVDPIFENVRENLIELFGEHQYNRVHRDVIILKKDSTFILPTWWESQRELEDNLEARNQNPQKRKITNNVKQ